MGRAVIPRRKNKSKWKREFGTLFVITMIPALLLGRKGSIGFPGKNTIEVLGRKLAEYPIIHAQNSKYIDKIYLSTDDPKLMELSKKHEIEIIERPEYLCTNEALGEDAFKHGYEVIKERNKNENIDLISLFAYQNLF
mgnify:CR=1 FL=1